ncbi:Uncharacterised protein [Streptococcus pneumoniae]|nr:Uncharacterised protein [Streptococcus pneumoniae]
MIFHLSTFTPESLVASSLLPSANVYLPIIVLFKIKLAKIAIPKKMKTAFGIAKPGIIEPIAILLKLGIEVK